MNKEATAVLSAKRETLKEKVLPKNWDIKDGDIEEEFFKAFERGERHGVESYKQTIKDGIKHRFNRAATLSETLFDKIEKDFKVDVKELILNYSNMPCFQSLFIIPRDFYLSDAMLEIYRESNKLKADFNDDNFRIDFKFMYDSESINYSLLEADGFVMIYKSDRNK